ncbi:LysR family transcriptional regulator [Streptomyces agglomeratus]|uniref:LysR family transcriptional regulator n=1 Tax=Streptomyces agglomeratus TaxID=285458 RepID=A0A1E5PFL2_9ACTN|nr:LysR family substrate-binding domain-containing protein [Streptomyces agglomeratus]OEJ28317.1 LysR family transcriptional regulator [Streptomyces agglomeratus]OEJ37618.1 LysR family transcriptional regulator [Streptomyces agglomeratus]OEJ47995.1 LysR family transcriptional regulator [Streptomyces agglomeratus]OEJ50157.1 LysR family transcriptional regulator [Streptomyces agglomeratus]OEJ57486.1 LysR family transcriptional regulator [Streptomyces agglomeratus]
MTGSETPSSFRLAYVPGVMPTKWVRIWNERLPGIPLTLMGVSAADAFDVLRGGDADAGFVRLPVDRTDLSAIPLYTETTVVVVPKDHPAAAVDEVSVADLADDLVLHPLDDTLDWERPPGQPANERPATTADAVELVAAGVGLLVVPQSLARLHHRRDLTYVAVSDAPQSRVALSWPQDETTDLVEQFIGIVRGRTVNSTRGRPPAQAAEPKGKSPDARGGGRKAAAGKPAGKSAARSGKAAGKSAGRNPRSGSGGSSGGSKGGGKRGRPRRPS